MRPSSSGGCAPFDAKEPKLHPVASGAVVLQGTISPPAPLAPDVDDDVVLTLADAGDTIHRSRP